MTLSCRSNLRRYTAVSIFVLMLAGRVEAFDFLSHCVSGNNVFSPWVFKVGYNYQQSSYIESGFIYARHSVFGGDSFGFTGLYGGLEARVGGSRRIFGGKVGVESHLAIFGGRAVFAYHTDFNRGAWQFSPEAGLSFGGRAYVFAGYNWTLSNRDFWDATGFKISAGINLIKR